MSNVSALLTAAAARRPAAKPKAEASADSSLVWENISPDELPADIRELYYAIGKARSTFEAAVTELLAPPSHLKLAFAYKRGLAVALAPKARPNAGLAGLANRISAVE